MYEKELKNTGTKELNSNLLVDTGLNIFSKKNKNIISSITGSVITVTNNEIKDIRPFENRGILLKGTTKKLLVKKKNF